MENKTNSSASEENSLGLKAFNRTGRDDTTREVLRQHVSPAVKQRNAVLIAIVVVALGCVGYLAYDRSGMSFADIMKQEESNSFGTGADKVQRRFDEP
jgi:fructose-1-phosphate kinase PfkB-like protein